ncbi:uncharacterized protein LOC131669897 isoform X2 [Phymastichus coffea]|uniref:uncharacterized protein LOC131669897 isoform X2 n=1 Tax=Phymastichus coffea TaxID=108790 RepID=UPI00273B4795|nr:uncharacterized protein LOC131669897 isoform X2 [Phymastichus coffea]
MFSILCIIVVVFLQLASARNDNLSKNYQFSNKTLVASDISFDNKTLFYALYTQSSKQCSVIQEDNPFTNYSVTKKCNFVLKVNKIQLIVGLGTEKAILIAQDIASKSLKLKAITVHIAECKIKEVDLVEVPSDWVNRKLHRDYIDVVVSEHGFDVIIKGLSHLCTKSDAKIYCGLSFDTDGNKIEGPLIWPKMAYEKIDLVSPIMADATGQGYFFVNRDTSLLAFQLNRKGPKYVKLWYTPIPHSNLWREAYSVANHVDGMCYNINSSIGCWQTDQEGEVKIQMEFEFDHKFKANIKQCNIPQTTKIEESTTQIITEDIMTQATKIPLTTIQETTVGEITTKATVGLGTTTADVTTNDTVIEKTTEEAIMEPDTVIGITVEDTTTQNTIALNDTKNNDGNNNNQSIEDVTQGNIIIQDSTTESNIVQDSVNIQNNVTQKNVTETDIPQNNVTEINTSVVQVATGNVTVENITEENTVLENITEINTVGVITVQDLTTLALTTQIPVTPENIATFQETTAQDDTVQDITVKEITTIQDSITNKSVVRRSLSQIALTNEQKVWNLFIHNLPNGGFIVLVVTCPNRICNGNEDHYYLMKINAQGKLIGQLEINITSKCHANSNEVFVKIFENDQGQYCSVRLCIGRKSKEEQMEILVNCYCNSDFK